MFGVEEHHIDHAHGNLEAGVEGGAGELVGGEAFEAGYEGATFAAEVLEDGVDGLIVVAGVERFAVGHVGGAECGEAGVEVVEAAQEEGFGIDEVAGVFLDGPRLSIAARQDAGGERADAVFDARRGAAQTLHQGRIEIHGEVKIEPPLRPKDACGHGRCFMLGKRCIPKVEVFMALAMRET